MDRVSIIFSANQQKLVCESGILRLAEGTVRYVDAYFDLGDNWTGFDSVRAIWTDGTSAVPSVLDHNGHCLVPSELLDVKGRVRVNLVGSVVSNEELVDRLTTNKCMACLITKDAFTDGTSDPIDPDQFEQFVGIVKDDANAAREAAESVEDSVDICVEAAEVCREVKSSTFYIEDGNLIWETEDIEQEVTNGN